MDAGRMEKTPAFAVVRLDLWHAVDTVQSRQDGFTVVKVLLSKEAADDEAARLNQVNADKDCIYWLHYTRLMTDGSDSETS